VKVAVCVATYLRPGLLHDLLDSLRALELDGLQMAVFVVDNDPSGSAWNVVDAFRSIIPQLAYEIEPKRGIAAARNRLVRLALQSTCDYVAFVDDDETVTPNWLSSLVRTAIRFQADVVTGPVIPRYAPSVPRWVIEGKFFERPRYVTGHVLDVAFTNNVLVKSNWLEDLDGPFREAFGLTGGSDTELFRRFYRAGAKIIWADQAVVYEVVRPTRARLRWLLQRALRGGNGVVILQGQMGWCSRVIHFLKGMAHICLGLMSLVPGVFLGTTTLVRGLMRVAKGLGVLLGVVGYCYEEYRHVSG